MKSSEIITQSQKQGGNEQMRLVNYDNNWGMARMILKHTENGTPMKTTELAILAACH